MVGWGGTLKGGQSQGLGRGLIGCGVAKLRQGQSLELQWHLGVKDGRLEDEFESEN